MLVFILQMFNNETTKPYPLNTSADNAAWVGLTKTDNLPKYLKGYIGRVSPEGDLVTFLNTIWEIPCEMLI